MGECLYAGKVKEVWSTDDPDILEFRYTNQISVFDQIPLTNRREIKSVAINKAQEERRHVLSVRARNKPKADVKIADLGVIWGANAG